MFQLLIPTLIQFRIFGHPGRKEQQSNAHTPNSFSCAQQIEIDRQVALQFQEMDITRIP